MVENPRPPEAQDPEKLRSELKIALTRDKMEENAYVIKTWADQLVLDQKAAKTQTRGMITVAELQQPGGTEIAGGHLNEAAQEWKELKADGKVPEKMNEKAIDICNKSFNYLKALQNDVKEKLIPSRASNAEAKEFRTDLRDNLNAILVKAMENGVIVYHEPSGKIRNSVGKAAAQLREVDELEQQILQSYGKVTREGKLPPELQIQLSLIDRTKDFFQMVIDGDPENKERHAALHPKEDMDPAYARYWNSLRMLALLASMGMLTASAIIDIKNKKLSVYTLVWLGIVSGTAGVFKGEEKVAMDQLKGFLPKNEWQKYEMNGKADADLLLSIRTEHEKDGEVAEKYKELKKEIGQTTLGKSRSPELKARLSVLQQQYYNLLRDKKGEPTANLLKEKVARASDDADHQPDSLIYLVDRATTTNDIAFGILLDLTKKGIGPESAGKDLAQKEENGDSKGTFHDYDSFSSSSGTNTSDTSSAATPIAAPTNPALSAAPSVATVVQETSPVTKGINETPMRLVPEERSELGTSKASESVKRLKANEETPSMKAERFVLRLTSLQHAGVKLPQAEMISMADFLLSYLEKGSQDRSFHGSANFLWEFLENDWVTGEKITLERYKQRLEAIDPALDGISWKRHKNGLDPKGKPGPRSSARNKSPSEEHYVPSQQPIKNDGRPQYDSQTQSFSGDPSTLYVPKDTIRHEEKEKTALSHAPELREIGNKKKYAEALSLFASLAKDSQGLSLGLHIPADEIEKCLIHRSTPPKILYQTFHSTFNAPYELTDGTVKQQLEQVKPSYSWFNYLELEQIQAELTIWKEVGGKRLAFSSMEYFGGQHLMPVGYRMPFLEMGWTAEERTISILNSIKRKYEVNIQPENIIYIQRLSGEDHRQYSGIAAKTQNAFRYFIIEN